MPFYIINLGMLSIEIFDVLEFYYLIFLVKRTITDFMRHKLINEKNTMQLTFD